MESLYKQGFFLYIFTYNEQKNITIYSSENYKYQLIIMDGGKFMYCRNCGNEIKEGDKFCSSCGQQAILANAADKQEEIVINPEVVEGRPTREAFVPPFENEAVGKTGFIKEEENHTVAPVEDFDWNIHTFPGMAVEKTADVDFAWTGGQRPIKKDMPEETCAKAKPEENLFGEAIRSSLEEEGTLAADKAPVTDEISVTDKNLNDTLFGQLDNKTDEARKQSEEIDKFFTFNKKNEAFQQLLDQEYQKAKSGNILENELSQAEVATEERFAAFKPEDPMEDMFQAEGIVKGYEPKPIDSDILEKIDAAEIEKEARLAAAQKRVDEAKAQAEKEVREFEEAAKARAEKEAAEKIAAEAEALKVRQSAQAMANKEREKAEAEARLLAEARARVAAESAKLKEKEARSKELKNMAVIKPAPEKEEGSQISEMAKAREQFFGEQAPAAVTPDVSEVPTDQPVTLDDIKFSGLDQQSMTKTIDKDAILEGIATATKKVDLSGEQIGETSSQPFPDFIGHLDHLSEEVMDSEVFTEADLAMNETPSISDTKTNMDTIVIPDAELAQILKGELEASKANDLAEEIMPIGAAEAMGQEEPITESASVEDQVTEDKPVFAGFEEEESTREKKKREKRELKEQRQLEKQEQQDAEENMFEEEEDGKSGKGKIVLKVCLVILIIILALEVAGVVITLTAPNSSAGQFVNKQLTKAVQLITGDSSYEVIAASTRTEAVEDKSEMIANKKASNKNNNIKSIVYNQDLKLNTKKTYEDGDIALSQPIVEVGWYKDKDGKQVYYDEEAVGAIIAFESQKVDIINSGDDSVLKMMSKDTDLYKEVKAYKTAGIKEEFEELQIGQIRVAGAFFYVWVSEKVTDTKDGVEKEKNTNKIYQLELGDSSINVVNSYNI